MTTDPTGSRKTAPPKVFISYNRADREWAEWIAGVLEGAGYAPFLQAWHILPGMNFGVEMHKAASESDFTLAVLSEPFLKSEFTLPEWIAAFVSDPTGRKRKQIPVRVAECDPPGMLKAVVYIDLVGLDESAAARTLLDGLKPTGKPTGPMRFPGQPTTGTVSPAPFPPLLGPLHGVPGLPTHFLERPADLAGLKQKLLGQESHLGITASGKVGVQGMGGIGKSVLAAALVRDPEIRRAFPDGICWLTVGQTPNLVDLQGKLILRLTGQMPTFTEESLCKDALRQALEGRRVLVVLDDVWTLDHADALAVTAPPSRLLVTTRNREVLVGLDAEEYQVDVLPMPDALKMLAGWAGVASVQTLPPEAERVVKECGCLPLALAMIGAMIRLRPTGWADALTRLRRADLSALKRAFPGYPYPDLLRAIEVSITGLEPEDRQRYLDLAVFPEDAPIPEAPLRLLWGLDEVATRDAMSRFATRSLATLTETMAVGAHLTLHDLQRDLIRNQREKELPTLHERLLTGYSALCTQRSVTSTPTAQPGVRTSVPWAQGPVDGYFFQRLAMHLKEAGRVAELRRLLLDFDWLQAKLNATEVVALIADYELLPGDQELGLVQGAIRLSSHVVSADKSQLAGQLIGRLAGESTGGICQLVRTAGNWRGAAWLKPRHASLHPPGTALLRTLSGHSDIVNMVALSPDGRLAVSASKDETLKVWDLESGRELRTFTGHSSGVEAVALSPDGRLAISASGGKTLKVWEMASGRELHTLFGHKKSVTSVTLSPDSRLAVSASEDTTLKVWELDSGRELRTLAGHSDTVNMVALSPDGRLAVSASFDQTLKVWELNSGRELRTLAGHSNSVNAVALSLDGRLAISVSWWDKTLKVWELDSGRELRTLAGHSSGVTAVALSPDGRLVVSASSDHTLKVWELDSGRELRTLSGHSNSVTAVALSPDGRLVVSVSSDQTLKVWELDSGRELRTLAGHNERVTAVALSPNGRLAVSASWDSTLKVWKLDSGRELRTRSGHSSIVNAVALSPDGRLAVSASEDKTLKVWELASGRELVTLSGHSEAVNAVAFSPDGRLAVSASKDRTLKVWELASGRELWCTLSGHNAWMTAVALSPDGLLAVSASWDNTLRVWELASGRELRTLVGHTRGVRAVGLSPDGRLAVSASEDRTLRVWELASGRELRTLSGHTRGVAAVALSPDGRLAVSASEDTTLKVWELASGEVLAAFTGEGSVAACAFAPDGRTIVAGDASGRLHFLHLVLPDDPGDPNETEKQRRVVLKATEPKRPRDPVGPTTKAKPQRWKLRLR